MYRYSHQVRMRMGRHRLRNAIMLALLIISLLTCILLSGMYGSAAHYRRTSREQIESTILSDLTNARTLAERLTSSVQSNTSITLSQIRQYIYSIDQMNNLSLKLDGESGRIVPNDAISALYQDIEAYFAILQTNTSSILETRTLLVNHLNALQVVLMESK